MSIFISWAMIVTILIYMYPLKTIFSSLFAVFALGFTSIALEVVALNLRAWQLRKPLRLNARERLVTLYEVTGWGIPVGIGIISFVLP